MADQQVPNTISDAEYRQIQDRAVREEMRTGGMFTPAAVKRRLASGKQAGKANQS